MSTYYVSSSAGSNGNAGTEVAPWATIAYGVTQMSGGDTLKLKCGDTFRENLRPADSGSAGAYTTFDSYSTGAKPIISGGVDLSSTSNWTNTTGNIWRATGLTEQIGQVFFNNDLLLGAYHEASEGTVGYDEWLPLTTQGDFYYNPTGDYLEIYSAGNPGSYYTHIEASTGMIGDTTIASLISNKSYVTIRNIQFKHTGGNALEIGLGSHHILIEYCDFYGCGGSFYSTDNGRNGNGMQTWNGITDLTVRYCTFDRIYETAMSTQGDGRTTPLVIDNIYYYCNVIKNSCCAFDLWAFSGSTGSMSDIYFCHNTVYNICKTYYPSWLSRPRAVSIAPYTITPTNLKVLNNIFHTAIDTVGGSTRPFISVTQADDISGSGTTIDYNCYYPDNVSNRFYYNGTNYTTFAAWKSASSQDAHGMTADPLFTTLGSDFNLQASSPCIDAGTDAGLGLTAVGGVFDLGRYEYDAEEAPTPAKRCMFRVA